MTAIQLTQKLRELEEWLKYNGSHPNYTLILQDKQKLEKQLKTRQDESKFTARNGAL